MSKARDLSKLDITDAVSVTVNNTATVAQMSTDANNALLVENTNAAGVSGLRMRGGSGKAAIMYGENNSTDEFSIIPRNDTSKAFTIDSVGNVVVAGNLQIEGSQTVLNTATLSVEDLNITVASGATTDSEANGAGLTVAGAAATLLYTATGDKWAFNKPLDVTGSVTSSGTLTAASLAVDNITIDGYEIDSNTDLTIDATGDIHLDADGGDIRFKDGGVEFYKVAKNGDHVQLFSTIQDGDLTFNGFDGSSHIVALTLDMSEGGNATFLGNVTTGASLISTNAIVDNLMVKTSSGSMLVKTNAGANIARFNNILTTDLFGSLDVTGNITVSGTVDGVDLQTLNTTAGAALPKAGGTMTGTLTVTTSNDVPIRLNSTDSSCKISLADSGASSGIANNNGSLRFFTGGDAGTYTGQTEYMRIASNGDLTLKSAGVVTLKAAPLGSTYGGGFNAITVTGSSGSPYTSTIGFSNYGKTDAMVIQGDNVGIGLTPTDFANRKSLDIGLGGKIWGHTSATETGMGSNFYFDGAYKRTSANAATRHIQDGNGHTFDVVASGLADATISWNTAMLINAAGNVLIGDTASVTSDLLQIETPASGGGGGIHLRRNDSNNDQQVGIVRFGNNSSANLAAVVGKTDGAVDNGKLIFRTRPSGSGIEDRMTIDADGNVGIGTGTVTSPGLWYDANPGYLAISHWATPPTPAAMLHLSDNSNDLDVPQIRIEGRENPGDTVLDIAVRDAAVRLNLVEGATDAGNGYGQMIFKTNAAANASNPTRGGFLFSTPASSSNLIITNTGNVGIGTASPTELLEVYSETASTAIEVSAGKASTTTGEAKIVLRSLHSASGTSYSRSEIASLGVAGGDSDLIFRTTSDSSGPQERLRITDAGDVIVNENGYSSDFRVEASGNSSAFRVDGTNDIVYINAVGSEAGSRFTINNNNSSTGHLQFQTAQNDQQNGYVRANMVLARNKDALIWDPTDETWDYTAGSSGDWSMISKTSGGLNFHIGAAGGSNWSLSNNDFNTAYLSYYITPTGGHTWEAPGGGDFVFNDKGLDRNFRVESPTNAHALFLDAGTDVLSLGYNGINGAFVDRNGTGFQVGPAGVDNLSGQMFMNQYAITDTWMDICACHDDGATGVYFTIHAVRTGDQNRSYAATIRYAYNNAFNIMTVSSQNATVEYRVSGNVLQYRVTTAGPYVVNLAIMAAG